MEEVVVEEVMEVEEMDGIGGGGEVVEEEMVVVEEMEEMGGGGDGGDG